MRWEGLYDTIWDRTSDLPICSTAPQPLCYRGSHEVKEYSVGIFSENDVEFHRNLRGCVQISEKFTDIEFTLRLVPCGQTVTRSKVTNIRINLQRPNVNYS